MVKGIAKLKVHGAQFARQAEALQSTHVVYRDAMYDTQLVAE